MPTSIDPLAQLIDVIRVRATVRAAQRTGPFMIGVGGPVAAGKSTFAAELATAIQEWPDRPSVEVLSTDSFLRSNAELERLGLTMSKGAPASYDHDAMRAVLARLRCGEVDVEVPRYSHRTYDLIPDEFESLGGSSVLIVEGLHVTAAADQLDVVLYLDADTGDLERWFIDRFERLRLESADDPGSFFHQFVGLDADTARVVASWTWTEINLVNIVEHIVATRDDADIVVTVGATHEVQRFVLR